MTGQILGFLDSIEITQLRAINREASENVLEFVESVELTPNTFCRVLKTESAHSFFSRLPMLRRLKLNCNSGIEVPTTGYSAEAIVSELGKAMLTGACPELECLSIRSFFFYQTQSNVLANLINALKYGKCSKLKELDLSANFLSDKGVELIAQVFLSNGCPKLRHVELKNNFIGEHGIHAIGKILSSPKCVHLHYLGLAGNFLTTSSIQVLSDAIMCGKCEVLEELDLENNFITAQGAYQLLQSLSIGTHIDRFQTLKLRGNQFVPQEKEAAALIRQHLNFNVETDM